MYYLIRAVPNTNACGVMTDEILPGGKLGLCSQQDFSYPQPVVKPKDGTFGFEKAEDLGKAIAKFLRETNKSIDAIAATGQIEGIDIPLFSFLPYVAEWDSKPPIVYARLSANDYAAVIQSMTGELAKKH